VVVTGLEAGETGWVNNFISQYKSELDKINRENTFIFCSAFYNYWIKNFSEALNLAAKVKTDDSSYKHQLKSLYLKIYYDLNETEPFYSHVDNYKHFISSEKNVGEQVRLNVNNYINYAKRLFDLKSSNIIDSIEVKMLENEIINNKAMINKPWLLRRIKELE
jgi:hypothetical protein